MVTEELQNNPKGLGLESPGTSNSKDAYGFRELQPFFWSAGVWLFLGWGIHLYRLWGNAELFEGLAWFSLLGMLGLLDLWAMSQSIRGIFLWMGSESSEKRAAHALQAFYWGLIKLASLGILIAILVQGSTVPTVSLVLGTSTLVVVPLIGGFWWNQKVLRHA